MNFHFNLDQKVDIHHSLVLTPQVHQSLKVLQMNSLELSDFIKQQAIDNPLIDIESSFDEMTRQEKMLKKIEWLCKSDSQYNVNNSYYQENDFEEYPLAYSDEDSLTKVLLTQLNILKCKPKLKRAARYIIYSLDNRGYLETSLEGISEVSGIELEYVRKALKVVQSFEPYGVGARNLQECLILQLNQKNNIDQNVYKVVKNYLIELSKNKLNSIASKLGISIEEVKDICFVLKSLNPYPGTEYSSKETVQYIYPDIVVVKFENYFNILINDFLYPSIKINNTYKELIHTGDESTCEFLIDKINKAMFLKKCILQRNNTLLAVATTIVELQKDFMNKGPGHFVPMVLNDIASRLDMHESTVSRAINGKYLQCIWGMFELKYFFSSSISNSDNNNTTRENIKLLLKQLIEKENKKKPLSDQKISEELEKNNISISRRTVAKYREELRIPNTSHRREF